METQRGVGQGLEVTDQFVENILEGGFGLDAGDFYFSRVENFDMDLAKRRDGVQLDAHDEDEAIVKGPFFFDAAGGNVFFGQPDNDFPHVLERSPSIGRIQVGNDVFFDIRDVSNLAFDFCDFFGTVGSQFDFFLNDTLGCRSVWADF